LSALYSTFSSYISTISLSHVVKNKLVMVFQRIHNGLKTNPTVPIKDISLLLPALNLMLIEASANVIA
jgi:hypothetical protein